MENRKLTWQRTLQRQIIGAQNWNLPADALRPTAAARPFRHGAHLLNIFFGSRESGEQVCSRRRIMGGGVSVLHRRTRRHVDLENRTPTPSTPRRTLNNGLTLLQNATCRFKISFQNYTKPFRELICNWPLTDVEALLEEFEANSQLYSLQQECDAARQAEINFSDHFSASRTSLANLKIIFKDQTFDVHHRFISFRCKYFKDLCATSSELDLTLHFEGVDVDDFRSFIGYVYTEKWEGDRENLEELRKKFECNGVLAEDCVLMEKEDLQSGDLIIGLSNTAENKTPFQPYKIRCDASIVGARSQLLQSLLARAPKNELDLTEITLDENIFPRALAPLFVHFFYTDQLDLNMISKSDMSLSSLSEAQAIISGRSPNLNLHRALQVMQVAKFFNIEKLVQLCEDVVVQSLSVENCVAVLNWASDGGSKFVARHALRIVEREFPKKIVNTPSLFDLSQETMLTITASQFVQVTEVELLEAIIKWGEHELLKRLEEREPNILADTCHSISRRGLRRAELSGDELKDILRPFAGKCSH
ncbi:unnamed protein product [Caenorhabditis auriculariae]|uniref:BTB domain-containing protein n=1 Tax=Caenorhabditis auriculariae TaxID=2777116 RepID=A0A8S1HC59_9PELO|nr:unnamed protein product [Caenorhabditis auriculariae]